MTRYEPPGNHELGSSSSWGRCVSSHTPRDDAPPPPSPTGVPGSKPLLFSYASPEQLKQAKLESLQHKMQESMKHMVARQDGEQQYMGPAGTRRASESETALPSTPQLQAEPGGQDQFTAFIRPPGMEGDGKQLKTTPKIIMQGKTQDYLRLQPDSKMRGAVQVDYGTFDHHEQPPSPAARKASGGARRMRRQSSSSAAGPGSSQAATAVDPRLAEQLRHSMKISSFVPVNIDVEGLPSKAFMTSSHVYRAASSQVDRLRASTSPSPPQTQVATTSTWQGFVNSSSNGRDQPLPVARVTEENLSVKLERDGYQLQVDVAEKEAAAAAPPPPPPPAAASPRQERQGQGQAAPEAAPLGDGLGGTGREPAGGGGELGSESRTLGAQQRGSSGTGNGPAVGEPPLSTTARSRSGLLPESPRPLQAAPQGMMRSRSALPPRSQLPGSRYPAAAARSNAAIEVLKPGAASASDPSSSIGLDASSRPHPVGASERLSRTTSSTMVPTRKTMARCRSGRLFGQTNQHSSLFSIQTPSVTWLEYSSMAQQRLDLQYRVLEYRSWQVQQAAVGQAATPEPGSYAEAPELQQQQPAARGRPESAPVSRPPPPFSSSLPTGTRPFSALPAALPSSSTGGGARHQRPGSALSTASRPGSAAASAAAPARRVRPPSAGSWAGRPRLVEEAQEQEDEVFLYDGWDQSTSASGTLQLTAAGLSLPLSGT